ncbi:ATP-binding protein [Petrachloros mirabilis]
MSWITVVWSMSAGISLSLAIVYFLLWVQEREARVNLAFALWALTTAVAALIELAMLHARLPGHYSELVRWVHLPYGVMTVVYLWFISLYLQSGRLWLRLLIYGIVALRLVMNFTTHPNFNFSEITALHYIPLWGELAAVPVGVKSPWQWIDEVSWVLVILFSADAIAGAWRSGRRRQSVVMGTCVITTNVLTVWLASITIRGTSTFPMTVSLPCLLILMVIAHELSSNLRRASKISEDLRLNQERMSLAAKATNLGLWEWDIERDTIWATDASRARIGAGENEKLTLERFLLSVHPEDREAVQQSVRRSFERDEQLRLEYRAVAPDGAVRWMEVSGQLELGANKKPLLFRGVSMDITERRLAEEAAQQIQRYRDMAADVRGILSGEDPLPDALKRVLVLIQEASGVNAAGIRLRDRDDFPYVCQQGFSEEFLRTENSLIAHRQDGSICRDSDGKISLECTCGLVISGRADPSHPLFTNGGSAWTNDSSSLLALTVDKDSRLNPRNRCIHHGYASIILAPIRAKAGIIGLLQLNDRRKDRFSLSEVQAIEALAETIGDAILRKQAEEAFRENLERYRAMVESFDGFVFICSADYRIEFMNQRMIEWTGRNAVGEFCYRVMHDNNSVCEWCVNDKVFQSETTVRWEVQSPKDQRWYYVVNTPIRHTDGTISKQAMIQDITERKKAESESSQLRLELAHLNRVLTMSELSSSLAHEINQPLGAILNNASTARMLHSRCAGGGGGEVAEILDDIISDTNRAGQIVRKIRGLIKKEPERFEPQDMNILVNEVVELFRNSLSREEVLVREDLFPDRLQVRGDRIQLQQVIMNLIMNATDAMRGSAVRIMTIRTIRQEEDKVMVSISDTGSGIEETMKDKLFTPFATSKKDGLGMGLCICRTIVENHGGSIQAVNNPEGGSTFSFTLKAGGGETE